ncbi:hypothetical protein AAAC51_25600 [Priestia megaterium]
MLKKANRTVMNMGLAALLVPAALTFSTTSASAMTEALHQHPYKKR